ncbi:MAG: ribonucleoside triphosphate reductase, partial [Clostridia bacterium]|nr:ribonucleoside triphosphate reductase [Clostridia bacterium]
CKAEMDMINRAFIETMIEGDAHGRGFQYPIPTYSITRDFDWSETENNKLLFEMTAKYGTPYFSNYINSDMEPSDVRSMCCRLRLDLRELRKKSGGFFGSGESTGSVGVVTINIPRIAYLAENEEDFYRQLDRMMDVAARSLKVKRDIITRLLDEGLYPYTKRYLGTFNNHFSTIGLIGMNEACLNAKWIQKDLTHESAQEFTKAVLNHMRERLSDYQEKYGDLYNLEATPAESTTYRLAKHDIARYPDIITAPGETPYYTNSSHLPVGYTEDIFSALDIQDELQTLYTSGTVFHAFLGEKLPSWKSAANLVRKIAENYKLPYYTMSPTYSVCKDHGYLAGEHFTCPECGNNAEVYSRITGYYRPVQNWNDGKTEEYKQRKLYDVANSKLDPVKHPQVEEKVEEPCTCGEADGYYLFTTKTCPNCPVAKANLDRAGIAYTVVDAEENAELSDKYGIRQAPTLVIIKDGQVEKAAGVSAILAKIR